MAHVLTDWRKTALGACGLALLALMFTHQGGVAESAVDQAKDIAVRKQDAIAAGAEEHKAKAWFAADESTYEVHAVAPPPVARPEALPQTPSLDAVHPPPPRGDDFPPGRGA